MYFDPMKPIWLQVATELKQQIVTGALSPGSKLPGGRDLAVAFGINPNTAARIYQELEREGICRTRRGLGTFGTEDGDRIRRMKEEMARNAVERFMKELAGLGLSREEAVRIMMGENCNAEK